MQPLESADIAAALYDTKLQGNHHLLRTSERSVVYLLIAQYLLRVFFVPLMLCRLPSRSYLSKVHSLHSSTPFPPILSPKKAYKQPKSTGLVSSDMFPKESYFENDAICVKQRVLPHVTQQLVAGDVKSRCRNRIYASFLPLATTLCLAVSRTCTELRFAPSLSR